MYSRGKNLENILEFYHIEELQSPENKVSFLAYVNTKWFLLFPTKKFQTLHKGKGGGAQGMLTRGGKM